MTLDIFGILLSLSLTLLAGVIRGYTGFGFSITVTLGLLWLLPPLQVITVVLLLDLLGALGLLKVAWLSADKALLGRLLPAMLVASVVGSLAMMVMPLEAAKIAIALLCLTGAIGSFFKPNGQNRSRKRDLKLARPAGALSGLAMSMASAGGPPLMLYLMYTTLSSACARATAIVFFIATSSTALLSYALNGAISLTTAKVAMLLLPAALLGAAGGQFLFKRYRVLPYRVTVSPLLILMAAWILINEFWPHASSSSSLL